MNSTYRLPLLAIATLLALAIAPISGCGCQDDDEYIWLFEEPEDELVDDDPDEPIDDVDDEDIDSHEDPDDWGWAFPDPDIDPDPPAWDETEWTVSTVADNIPQNFADNDRTSLITDREGTLWLGYHRCAAPACFDPELVVGHRRVGESTFTWETIEAHSGLFGLAIIDANRPIAIYIHTPSNELRAAMREPSGRWIIEALPVEDARASDGFDVSYDRARFYVSHASNSRRSIEFFEFNTAAPVPIWRRLQPRENARSAAYERGLRAGNDLNFYLVHQDDADRYRLSEYDLGRDEWIRSTGTYPSALSSLLVRQNGDLCSVGPASNALRVTCGSFDNPLRLNERLHDRSVYYLSSLIENRQEDLFIAYHDAATQDLHIARQSDGAPFSIESVHPGETFGASTAIDHRDHLMVSFYHCPTPTSPCQVRLLERTPQ